MPVDQRFCLECGKVLEGPDAYRRKFCSRSCSARHNNRLRVRKERCEVRCLNCGKVIENVYASKFNKYCSISCQHEHERSEYIRRWKAGEASGLSGKYELSRHVRRYLMEKSGCRCSVCGWGEVNPHTGKVPLQVHHLDGDCRNTSEGNLQVLCPNCHALTENFGSRNRNASYGRSEYYRSERRKRRGKKQGDVNFVIGEIDGDVDKNVTVCAHNRD